jgi:RNA polymerase sigma-70 factor (ECF subfamily)
MGGPHDERMSPGRLPRLPGAGDRAGYALRPMFGSPLTLEQLAARAARGDRRAMREIYERTADELMRRVIGPILVERAACEDALKETFVSALERLPALADGEVLPWLAAIARNKALDRRRRMSTEGRYRAILAAELGESQSEDPESALATIEARGQARARVEAVLARMNPRYAEAMRLRLLQELPREQCAARLQIKVGNFDVLFFRACKQFRALYVEEFGQWAEV